MTFVVSLAFIILALALTGSFIYTVRVASESREADRLFSTENRQAIISECLEREDLKAVVREIMVNVIAFNERTGTPDALERAQVYRHIVSTRLTPESCIVE
jgi:hypothetical protein